MIVQPVDDEYLEKGHLCAKCNEEITHGDVVVDLNVLDVTKDELTYTSSMKNGIHPTVHYRCLSEEDRPVVVSYD